MAFGGTLDKIIKWMARIVAKATYPVVEDARPDFDLASRKSA
jgi:hypothetical protein